MLVCETDAKGKQVAHRFGREEEDAHPVKGKKGEREPETEEIVENYGEVMRKARDALGLPLKVLGERINEKESTLLRIEKQKMLPNEKTRAKLEKELGIKLTTMVSSGKAFLPTKKNEPSTLWDIAKKKEEEQGE